MRVTLRILAGPYSGREFTFDQHDTFLIGRSDSVRPGGRPWPASEYRARIASGPEIMTIGD